MDWWLDHNVNPVLARSLFSTFFLLGTLIGLIGSTVILIAIKQKAIRVGKITTALIQHLAVLDLLATLFILFPTCLAAITDRWLLGENFCDLQAYSRWFLFSCTVLLTAAMNCSKLASMLFPFRGAEWTYRQGNILASCMWVASLALVSIFFLQKDQITVRYFNVQLSCNLIISQQLFIKSAIVIFSVILLGTVIVVISGIWLIVIAVRMSHRQGRSANLQGIFTVILIAVVYCISMLPLFGHYVLKVIYDNRSFKTIMFCKCIPYLNNIANVFIYTVSITSFRNFIKAKFFAIFSCFVTQRIVPPLITARTITESIQIEASQNRREEEVKKTVAPQRGNRKDVDKTVATQSGNRKEVDETVVTQSGNRKDVDETVVTQSGNRKDVDETVVTQSGNRKEVGETVATQSGNRKDVGETVATQSGNRKDVDETVVTQSGNRKDVDETVVTQSGNRKEVGETVATQSGNRKDVDETPYLLNRLLKK